MSVVSVLVIAGTDRPYLASALSSLKTQEFQDWEAIVIECCADPEASIRVLNTVAAANDPRIKPFRYTGPEVGFPPYASRKWNWGLQHTNTPLVAFLDDDDEKGGGWLSEMTGPLLAQPELTGTVSRGVVIDKDGAEHGNLFGIPDVSWPTLVKPEFVTTGQIVVRRAAIDKIGGFDEALGCAEDWDFLLRLSRDPWQYVGSVVCKKRDRVDNAVYHSDVVTHTQIALRRIIEKLGLAPSHCEGCGIAEVTFVRAAPGKGFRLWCGANCAQRFLGG